MLEKKLKGVTVGVLNELRKNLDDLDGRLVELLGRRKQMVAEIIGAKVENNLTLRDKDREAEHIANLIQRGRSLGLDSYFITKVFNEIIDYSLRVQQEFLVQSDNQPEHANDQIVIAFQGIEGAYSHHAGQKYFASKLEQIAFRGLPTFKGVVESVEKGGADFAILPIENTTAGSINECYDLLSHTKLSIVGEEILSVNHCLMANEQVPLARIRRIYSHPKALEQCSDFLATLEHCTVESFVDTAMAVKKIKDENDLSSAAIASEFAAQMYGLTILKKGIANTKANYTRFFIVARNPVKYDLRIPCKTSLILATKHVEGALVHCLNVLAKHHLNMTKLESRPRPNVPWESLFYVDFEGNIENPEVKKALDELAGEVSYLKLLGSYPAKTIQGAQPVNAQSISRKAAKIPEMARAQKVQPKRSGELPEKKPYRLASRCHKESDTLIRVKDVVVGGEDFVVIAGPCSVESREQVRQCAKAAKEAGADILRGGVFKPRTSPYSFQGLGFEGLRILAEAGEEFGLPIITEVVHPEQLESVASEAHILQIGARNMQNFALLREVGQVNKPVFLKRGMMASLDELLAAAEYILSQGNQQVILCERGIRTFETATRNTLDISAVPVLQSRSHLPVFVDPSHAAGDWRWVTPLSEAALATRAHGIMVEIHPNPKVAKSDGEQSLKFETFFAMMERLKRLRRTMLSTRQEDGLTK